MELLAVISLLHQELDALREASNLPPYGISRVITDRELSSASREMNPFVWQREDGDVLIVLES